MVLQQGLKKVRLGSRLCLD